MNEVQDVNNDTNISNDQDMIASGKTTTIE